MENLIPLVDNGDEVTGYDDKMDVHRKGLFSIVVFNEHGQILCSKGL